MHCLTCRYPLKGLPEPRCPECGRGFDPDSPATCDTGQPRPFARVRRALIYVLPLPFAYLWAVAQFGGSAHWLAAFCAGGPTLIVLASLRVPAEIHGHICAVTFTALVLAVVLTPFGRARVWLHILIATIWWLSGIITIFVLVALAGIC